MNPLKRERVLAGVTQTELAHRLGRTQSWLSKIETGRRPVTRAVAAKVRRALRTLRRRR